MTNKLSEKSGGGLIYNPPMMEFDGSTGYYSASVTTAGNKVTVVGRFQLDSFTGDVVKNLFNLKPAVGVRAAILAVSSDYSTLANRRDKLQFYVIDSTGGTYLARLITPAGYIDGQPHTFFASHDGDTGASTFIIDGVDADDSGNADRVAPTTGTLSTGATTLYVGSDAGPANYFPGELGFFGHDESALSNWQDFMHSAALGGGPKQQDFSVSWANTGWGSQPLFWHPGGKMDDNLGSEGAMTENGTITLADVDYAPMLGLPTIGTAEAWDLKSGKVAWVDGVEKFGTGYFPAMMDFGGSAYYIKNGGFSPADVGVTCVVRFAVSQWSSGQPYTCAIGIRNTSEYRLAFRFNPSDAADANLQDCVSVRITNSGGTEICNIVSPNTYLDGELHTAFFAYDSSAGTAIFRIDGVDADDTGNGSRILTTGTMETGSGVACVGSLDGTNRTVNSGDLLGFVGYADDYLTNWSDFMQTNGTPKQLDELTWTEWGAQPLFWNEHGYMVNNLGSAGAMTKNGTINVTEGGGGVAGMTANAWDIKSGKTAYLAGGSTTGTGYFPAMMQFDGSTGYYDESSLFTTSGNKVSMVVRFARSSFTGGAVEQLAIIQGVTHKRCLVSLYSSDYADADRQNKIGVSVANSAGTNICLLFSVAGLFDGLSHTLFFSFDGDNGLATFIIDGSNADDSGNADRVAPTVGTLESTSSSQAGFGAWSDGTGKAAAEAGFFGYRDAYLTNWQDFMQTDGSPKKLDESTWTEWGAQPLFWNEHGDMVNNLGSAGAMTKNGTINVASAQ